MVVLTLSFKAIESAEDFEPPSPTITGGRLTVSPCRQKLGPRTFIKRRFSESAQRKSFHQIVSSKLTNLGHPKVRQLHHLLFNRNRKLNLAGREGIEPPNGLCLLVSKTSVYTNDDSLPINSGQGDRNCACRFLPNGRGSVLKLPSMVGRKGLTLPHRWCLTHPARAGKT